MNRRPCGSKISEKEIWVEETEIICHVKSRDVGVEKRNKLDSKVTQERKSRAIDACRGAMIIS